MQLRLVYSLLKPAVRAAATFNIPIRSLLELVRLGLFENLSHQGLSVADIAQRFGQTPRSMRSLAAKLRSDFFAAEQEIGLARAIEDAVAKHRPRRESLAELMPAWSASEVIEAAAMLEREGRIEETSDVRLVPSPQYTVLDSSNFKNRVDALNHHLDTTHRAVMHRLIFDDSKNAAVKTISFSATPEDLQRFFKRLEGDLRREIAELEERAEFVGDEKRRYSIGMALAPLEKENTS
jgi:hypothetical protein